MYFVLKNGKRGGTSLKEKRERKKVGEKVNKFLIGLNIISY